MNTHRIHGCYYVGDDSTSATTDACEARSKTCKPLMRGWKLDVRLKNFIDRFTHAILRFLNCSAMNSQHERNVPQGSSCKPPEVQLHLFVHVDNFTHTHNLMVAARSKMVCTAEPLLTTAMCSDCSVQRLCSLRIGAMLLSSCMKVCFGMRNMRSKVSSPMARSSCITSTRILRTFLFLPSTRRTL